MPWGLLLLHDSHLSWARSAQPQAVLCRHTGGLPCMAKAVLRKPWLGWRCPACCWWNRVSQQGFCWECGILGCLWSPSLCQEACDLQAPAESDAEISLAGEGHFIAPPEATSALGLLLPWQALHLLRNGISV